MSEALNVANKSSNYIGTYLPERLPFLAYIDCKARCLFGHHALGQSKTYASLVCLGKFMQQQVGNNTS